MKLVRTITDNNNITVNENHHHLNQSHNTCYTEFHNDCLGCFFIYLQRPFIIFKLDVVQDLMKAVFIFSKKGKKLRYSLDKNIFYLCIIKNSIAFVEMTLKFLCNFFFQNFLFGLK